MATTRLGHARAIRKKCAAALCGHVSVYHGGHSLTAQGPTMRLRYQFLLTLLGASLVILAAMLVLVQVSF